MGSGEVDVAHLWCLRRGRGDRRISTTAGMASSAQAGSSTSHFSQTDLMGTEGAALLDLAWRPPRHDPSRASDCGVSLIVQQDNYSGKGVRLCTRLDL